MGIDDPSLAAGKLADLVVGQAMHHQIQADQQTDESKDADDDDVKLSVADAHADQRAGQGGDQRSERVCSNEANKNEPQENDQSEKDANGSHN